MRLLKITVMTLATFALFACKQEMTYQELLRNPSVLQEKITQCENQKTAECDEVNRAGKDFFTLNTEFQQNPELFGQKVLSAQQERAKNQAALQVAEQDAKSNPQQVKTLRDNLQDQTNQINAMLAVVATTSPE